MNPKCITQSRCDDVRLISLSVLFIGLVSTYTLAAAPVITLEIDARDVMRGIQHAHLTIPVRGGLVTLAYPKWIPGEHAVEGPITQLVGLRINGGRLLEWRRDPLDPYSFLVEVPRGIVSLDVQFDYLSPSKAFGEGYGKTPNVTPHLLVVLFNHYILYPLDASTVAVVVKASVRIPPGWRADGALKSERMPDGTLALPPTSLSTLVDSPILAGEFLRSFALADGADHTRITIAADAPADIAIPETTLSGMRRLTKEAALLFGNNHYTGYVWLVALSNTLYRNGLEHLNSTDIRAPESYFTDPARLLEDRTIPHEFVHSWNGKYMRPLGLATRNYQEPMVDNLLWVYEGMTRYFGDLVLKTRSGLNTLAQARAYIAWAAALMDKDRPGRGWRSVADTATALPGYQDAPDEWSPIRRQYDYYDEMLLVWLDADTLIREVTNGRHSLDDFGRDFFGGSNDASRVTTYTRSDIVTALHAIAPVDWNAFLTARVDKVSGHVPLDGIRRGGWKLAYDDLENEFLTAREKIDEADNLSLSLGVWTRSDGTVVDVVHGSPIFEAGVAPGMRLLAIDGHKWDIAFARNEIVRAEKSAGPIQLIVEAADTVRTVLVNYHGGLRNPHLRREAAQSDLLTQILAAKVAYGPQQK